MNNTVDMRVDFAGINMKNPVNTCSGTFGGLEKIADFVDFTKLGAVTTKGVAKEPWGGNDQPRMFETPCGVINSIGLQNAGVKGFLSEEGSFLEKVAETTSVIVNIAGHVPEDFGVVIDMLEDVDWISGYEVNVSCPNLEAGGSALGKDPETLLQCVEISRKRTNKPLIIKLTPDTGEIDRLAQICEYTGADALSLINTIPSMAIDVYTKKSRISKPTGGLSGPAIHPIAVRFVWQAAQAVSIPILAMGGITCGEDAAEFILAGASAISVGTQNLVEPTSSMRIADELEAWATSMGVSSISELVGQVEC